MNAKPLLSIAATAILSAAFISVMAAPAAAADCAAANTGALFCWETELPIDPRAIAALEGVPALARTEVWACAPDRDGGVRCAPRARDGSDVTLRTSAPQLGLIPPSNRDLEAHIVDLNGVDTILVDVGGN